MMQCTYIPWDIVFTVGCLSLLGKCFCLYPEDRLLPDETHPHILECDITSSVLFLKRIELSGVGPCDFIDRPGESLLMGDLVLLHPGLWSFLDA